MSDDLDRRVAELAGASRARRVERIVSLWSGYGEILRYALEDGPAASVVVKYVAPPPAAHPRKLRSYQVERQWYSHWSEQCSDDCPVPACIGTWTEGAQSLFVLEDLDAAGFTGRRRSLSEAELDACLSWLANFHATFMGRAPTGLWKQGTYWHLATRPDELRAMRDQALKQQAATLDSRLSGARHLTIVHGDAKAANFCFRPGDHAVAAVDFQYVGGGCGMKDVAYLLGGQCPEQEEERWLERYFVHLKAALPQGAAQVVAEWRPLYDVARLDFARFLDGWR